MTINEICDMLRKELFNNDYLIKILDEHKNKIKDILLQNNKNTDNNSNENKLKIGILGAEPWTEKMHKEIEEKLKELTVGSNVRHRHAGYRADRPGY